MKAIKQADTEQAWLSYVVVPRRARHVCLQQAVRPFVKAYWLYV